VTTAGVALSVDPGQMASPVLPLAVATFQPQSLGGQPAIRVTASGSDFTVRLSGVLRVPSLSDGLAVTLDGLEVGTSGVRMPAISLSGQSQQFTLFGATFALHDSTAGGQVVFPALAGNYAQGVLTLTLSGSVTFLENTTSFTGFSVSSAGAVRLASASLISKPIALVPNAISVDSLVIHDNRLRAALTVTLPEPLDQGGPQHGAFEVGADGTVSGGANLTLVDEPEGLNAQSPYQFQLGAVTVHLRRLGLALDAANLRRNSAVTVVGDIYVGDDAGNLIRLGDVVGGTVRPGLRIGFDGTTTWGNLALAREFDFDFDAVRLHLTTVALPAQPTGFAVSFGGTLSLRAPDISGSLAFQGFTLTSRGAVLFSANGVSGGSLHVASDLAILSVTEFAFSATPTTLDIRAGGMPTAGQAASGATERVVVASYVRFGGRLTVANAFSGTVGEFLAYRTPDAHNHLIIHDAELNIQGVLTARADLRYDENAGGFAMVVGGQGQLLGKEGVILVGALAREQQTTRVGIFVAAQGLEFLIPGTPVTITDLGGGFFLNPTAATLGLVRSAAGVSQTAGQLIAAPPGDFAVLLYAKVKIVNDAVVTGKILLTLMNTAMQIDGSVVVLDQGDHFTGDMHLVIGLHRAYAEGNIGLRVGFPGVLDGTGQLNMYVYDGQHWGINGNIGFTIMQFLQGSSKFFIGPPGMVVQARVTGGFDIWVVKIDNSFDFTVWYKAAGQEWGGYVAVDVKAAVLGGLLSATGTLKGALILSPAPFVYAAAELKVSAAGQAWDGVVWVKFENGKPAAGFGSDPAMDAAIAAAVAGATDMTDAASQAQTAMAAVSAVRAPQTALTEQELVQAYNRVQGWSPTGWVLTGALMDGAEKAAPVQTGEATYRGAYLDAMRRVGIPGDSTAIVGYARDVASGFSTLESRRPAVQARIAALRVTLQSVTPTPLPAIPDNPVRDTSFAAPVFTNRVNAAGDTERVMTSGPRFDVDVSAAQAGRAAVGQARAQSDALDLQVREQIAALEAGLTSLRAATTAGDSSLPAFAGQYASIGSLAERQFATQADLLLLRQDWLRARLRWLYAQDTTTTRWIHGKDATYAGVAAGAPWADSASAWTRVAALAGNRLAFLITFSGSTTLRPQFVLDTAAASHLKNAAGQNDWGARLGAITQLADQLGRQLWYDIARAGMEAANAAVDSALPAIQTATSTRLGVIRDAHGQISQSLAGLYAAQASATGALYDLYDRYLFWRTGASGAPGAPGAGPTASATPPTVAQLADTALLQRRRSALSQDLTVPRVTGVQVTAVSSDAYAAQLQFSWSASHPSGTYEYQFRDVDGANQALGGTFYSNGISGTLAGSRFTADPSQATTVSRTFQVGVRGGAGFTGFGRTNYSVTFRARAPFRALAKGDEPVVSGGGLAPDSTPPSRPAVTFPGRTIRTGSSGQPEVWTSDPQQIAVAWSADDPESGVASYEYALWSTPQGTEVRPFVSAGGRTDLTLDRLALTGGQTLYVAVRAKNPAGATSPVGVSAALRYDGTAPAFAAGAAIQAAPLAASRAAGALAVSVGGTTIPVVSACPATLPAGARPGAGTATAETPAASFSLPYAADAESGIESYWYKVGAAPATTFDASGWARVAAMPSLTVSGTPLTYADAFYLSVAPMNYAGLAGPPIGYGPFRVSDPTPPTDPQFCAARAGNNDRFAVQFTGWAADPETGVQGYRYRIRNATGAAARAWPATGVDWPPDNAAGTLGSLRTTSGLSLVSGQTYYVDVRPVNGGGAAGNIIASGPFLFDSTPPPTPAVSARYAVTRVLTTVTVTLTVTLTAPNDPETGLTGVLFTVGKTQGASDVIPWTTAAAAAGTTTTAFKLPAPLPSGTTFWLQVRTVNGAGQSSAVGAASLRVP
jgi:hypothetical protein